MPRRHEDGLAGVQHMGYAVHGHAAHAVQARHQRVAAGLVGADLLVLVEGKQRHTDGVVLGQRLADHLPRLIGHLIPQGQHGGHIEVLHHSDTLLFIG